MHSHPPSLSLSPSLSRQRKNKKGGERERERAKPRWFLSVPSSPPCNQTNPPWISPFVFHGFVFSLTKLITFTEKDGNQQPLFFFFFNKTTKI
jgi:hypothetical protein